MTTRIKIAPEIFVWAGDRSRKTREALLKPFPMLPLWEKGTAEPTFIQLEAFARATYTPIGYFFLPEPPEILLSIPDLRTVGSKRLDAPSPNLLDTVAICLDRQDWYRSYLIEQGEEPLSFVASLSTKTSVREAADTIREQLDFAVKARASMRTWEEALQILIANAENAGILVMISGVVGSDTHRKLDSDEFRGFALSDAYAPVIFVNGADAKSAQIFTLVHELVHIWLGSSGVTNWNGADEIPDIERNANSLEYWVNAVTAELLIPEDKILSSVHPHTVLADEVRRLSRIFKVSNVVVLRRLADLQLISWPEYRTAMNQLSAQTNIPPSDGGSFYNTAPVRASRRFTRAVVASTLEGRTLYRDAFRLLGFNSQKAFDGLSHRLELA